MYPILFQLGPIAFYSYGFLIALGFLVGTYVYYRLAKEEDFDEETLLDGSLVAFFSGLVGARIYYVIFSWDTFGNDILRMFHIIAYPGLGILGGLIGGFLGIFIFAKSKKIDFLKFTDIGVVAVSLSQAIGRIGCFLNGCCYGKETDLFLGVRFPGLTGRRHPTQIYEGVLDLLMFFILYSLFKRWAEYTGKSYRQSKKGLLTVLYFFFFGLIRIGVEFFRDDSVYLGGVSVNMVISGLFVGISLLIMVVFFREQISYFFKRGYKKIREINMKKTVNEKMRENFGFLRKLRKIK